MDTAAADALRRALDDRDAGGVRAITAARPEFATAGFTTWPGHRRVTALGYLTMLRYDTVHGVWRDVPGTGPVAEVLLRSGAPLEGARGDRETPLMTAASYGDVEVARVLVAAGAELDPRAAADAGGVPGGTALLHAAVFGMTDIVDLLARAGAHVDGLIEAAAVGDIPRRLTPDTSNEERVLALIMAADHERLAVIDALLDAGTPIDAEDGAFGRQALRVAAANGRLASVRHLLARGANPNHRDPVDHRTALEWCRRHDQADGTRHEAVAALLGPLTAG